LVIYYYLCKTLSNNRMKILFKDVVLLEIYQTGTTKDKRYKSLCKSKKFVDGYTRVIKTMYSVDSTNELKLFSFYTTKN
jgi:hypothetical protein